MEKDTPSNGSQKKPREAIPIFDKVDFKPVIVKREDHYIMIESVN